MFENPIQKNNQTTENSPEKIPFSGQNFNRNHWEVIDEYFPEFEGQSIQKIAENLRDNPERLVDLDIIMFDSLWHGSVEKAKPLVSLLIEIYGVETTRDKINKWITESPLSSADNYNQKRFLTDEIELRSLITPNHDKIAIENLQKFYQEKIKFEDYKVNREMNAGEVKLLQEIIGKNEAVLEEGCGTGRLLLEMKKTGYDITGFDFTVRHTEIIKEQDPEAKVLQGDWHQTGFKDGSFDTIYSLGRNILHDYSIIDQAQLFREAARILKPGGKFIFDIPNREKGGYKEMVDEYGKEMRSRGIKNFRQGTIYDSPDSVNFTTRYAYSEDDIKMLTDLAGFKIIETRHAKLATGKGDETLYYVLEKILSKK